MGHGPYDIVQIVVSLTWLKLSSHRNDFDQVYSMHFVMHFTSIGIIHFGLLEPGRTTMAKAKLEKWKKNLIRNRRKWFRKSNIDYHINTCNVYLTRNLWVWLSSVLRSQITHSVWLYVVPAMNSTWHLRHLNL